MRCPVDVSRCTRGYISAIRRRTPAYGWWVLAGALPSAAMADDISTLRRILKHSRTIAVVGLSAEWHRPSFFAAKYMQGKGYRILPVNPRYESILGERCFA